MRNLTIAAVFYFAFLFPGLPYPHQTQSQTQTEKMNKMIGILQLERVTKKVMKCFFWFVCIILLNSCDDNVIQSALIGDWQIDSITYKGNNSLFCLNSNYLIFNNNDVKFPSSQYRCESLSNLEEKGKWGVKLNKDNKSIFTVLFL